MAQEECVELNCIMQTNHWISTIAFIIAGIFLYRAIDFALKEDKSKPRPIEIDQLETARCIAFLIFAAIGITSLFW